MLHYVVLFLFPFEDFEVEGTCVYMYLNVKDLRGLRLKLALRG